MRRFGELLHLHVCVRAAQYGLAPMEEVLEVVEVGFDECLECRIRLPRWVPGIQKQEYEFVDLRDREYHEFHVLFLAELNQSQVCS
jgi:hypothetical protein